MKTRFTVCLLFTAVLLSCSRKKEHVHHAIAAGRIITIPDNPNVSETWSSGNTIYCHVISEPDNLHPSNGSSSPRNDMMPYLHETILAVDHATLELIPSLVESLPEISDDGLHYTYKLRKGITWDDGSPLTATDVLFTAKANKCPFTNNAPVRSYWENMNDVVIYKDEPLKFTIVMKEKNFQNLSFMAAFPVIQKSFYDRNDLLASYPISELEKAEDRPGFENAMAWAKEYNDDKYGRDPRYMSGLGNYKVTGWEPGRSVTISRKQKLNGIKPAYADRIIFIVNRDETSQLFEFKSGRLDVSANLSVGLFTKLSEDSAITANYNLNMMPTFNYSYVGMNMKPDGVKRKKLFTDVNVRKAIAYITPVEKLMKLVYGDYSSGCRRMLSNISPLKENFDTTLTAVPFDRHFADSLLSSAGWSDSDKDGLLDREIDGMKVAMDAELIYLNTSADWRDMAMLIAAELKLSGIQVRPVPLDLKLFLQRAHSHDFDLILGSWGGTSLPEDFTQLWHTKSWLNEGSNYTGFGDKRSDALIDSLRFTLDKDKRREMEIRFQRMVYDEQPYVFLFTSLRRNITHRRFGNITLFADRPGLSLNEFRLLSTTQGINQ